MNINLTPEEVAYLLFAIRLDVETMEESGEEQPELGIAHDILNKLEGGE